MRLTEPAAESKTRRYRLIENEQDRGLPGAPDHAPPGGGDGGADLVVGSVARMTFDVSRTLAAGWGPVDEVVVSRLDHDANVRPWVSSA
jgi:hypothetical protein